MLHGPHSATLGLYSSVMCLFLFHLLQIGPALDTFRDPEAREKAMAAHYTDAVARRGLLGQGTYTVD